MAVLSEVPVRYHGSPWTITGDSVYVDLSALEDIELVERAKRGDYPAFEQLVRRYRNDVYAVCYRYVSNREESWDLSQEVFIKAHRGIKRFRGDAGFKTWLLRITANRCKDYYKKRKLKTVALDDASARGDAPSTQLGPDQVIEARELGDAIQTAVDELSEKHRLAFVLREYENLSYQEIAETMACSIGTVMSRLHNARKNLQTRLREMGVVEGGPS